MSTLNGTAPRALTHQQLIRKRADGETVLADAPETVQTNVLSILAMCLIFVFLVTSADSASYIVAQMTDEGSLEPPLYKRLSWGLMISAICLTLIVAGGLKGLQTGSLLAALPFLVILYFMVFVLTRELRDDRRRMLMDLYEKHESMPVGADAFEARDILNDVWDDDDYEDADDEGKRSRSSG